MEEMKYEQELWGKVEFLHERYKKKHLYVSNFIEMITKFQNSCLTFSKSLSTITNKNYQFLEEKNNSIFSTIDILLSFINLQSQEFNELFNNIKSNILEPTVKLLEELNHKEKDLYILYNKSRTQYNNSKISLEKAKKEYENNLKMCEKAIFNAKTAETNPLISNEDKDKNMNKANNIINSSKSLEDKYVFNIEEANKMRTNEYNKEKELLNFYQKIDSDNYNTIKGMIGIFVVFIKKMYKSIFTSIEILSDQYQNINVINDLNNFMKKNKSEDKPDEPIDFIPYIPEANLQTTSLSGDPKETEKLQINFEVISTLRKSFKNICQDLNMEHETKKHRLRILSLKIFKIGPNVTFTQKEKDELISYLEIPEFRTYFIINLSKQRTNSRFQRSEKLLNDLAEIFDFILEISEKDKNYEEAKNCLILSQTFYTEITIKKNKKKEKYKRYLMDYILDNKWLKNIAFWEGIIEFMIQKEIKKNEEINAVSIAKETLAERKLRISNICFSQLLPYTNNMREFYIKKDVIKNIVDLFVKKYDIEKNIADMIYDNVENSPEMPSVIPIIRRRRKKRIFKKSKSFNNKNDYNINIEFEFIKPETKKMNSVKKYLTKIHLEDTKFKLQRKNELSQKFKSFDFGDDSEYYNDSSSFSKMSSSNINSDSFEMNRKQSYSIKNCKLSQKMENHLKYTPTMSSDLSNIVINIEQNYNEEDKKVIQDKNVKNNNINENMENSSKINNEKQNVNIINEEEQNINKINENNEYINKNENNQNLNEIKDINKKDNNNIINNKDNEKNNINDDNIKCQLNDNNNKANNINDDNFQLNLNINEVNN